MARETQQDTLGRELRASSTSGPQTVTQFAVEQGVLEKDASVAAAIEKEQAAAKAGTARAEQVHDALNRTPVASEENDGE